MLAIRLQRTGRKGHAQFRVLVQDARRTPSSGRFVAALGSYNPHTKQLTIDKEKVAFYLKNGARPSDRVAKLLSGEKIELPAWVKLEANKQRALRHPDKLRKNQPQQTPAAPAEPAPETESATPADQTTESS